ncbi:uncharacterized protein LOC135582072 isoform X7 [Musa acuminata AAA Group]|uniref:uncharacterized protein LOC135582072 isoform X7 n=1 Tax=Musa acuminata AAA Group TaxID=214697 RepID=UPI0031D43B17
MDDSSDQEKDVNSSSYHQEWRDDLLARRAQESLKKKLVLEDDFAWGVPSQGLASGDGSTREKLKYIGGVDISFLKKDPSVSCGALVVLDADTMDVVHEEFEVTRLQVPYVPGFLAFREAPMLLGLLNKMKANAHPFYPQLLMVDGNGLLHPRGLGLACHLGILANLPTIGIGKNAMRSILGSSKPIYVSIGHRISLDSAISIVKTCCKYRIPEPIRQVISWTPRPSIYQRHQEGMKTYLRLERTLSNMKA